jgi:recombination protein RecA
MRRTLDWLSTSLSKGISREGDILDLAVEKNIIEKSGAWFSYGKERIGQGRENSRIFLREHPEITGEVKAKLLEELGFVPPPALQGKA